MSSCTMSISMSPIQALNFALSCSSYTCTYFFMFHSRLLLNVYTSQLFKNAFISNSIISNIYLRSEIIDLVISKLNILFLINFLYSDSSALFHLENSDVQDILFSFFIVAYSNRSLPFCLSNLQLPELDQNANEI